MLYGLLAAAGWGTSGLAAAFAARRLGAFLTVLIGEAIGLAGFLALLLAGHASLRGAGPTVWPLLAAGAAGVGGYLAFYRGLEIGHVGLVSAVAATYGGVIVLLSVAVLGERLNTVAAAGVAVAVTGVMLAAWRGRPAEGGEPGGPGGGAVGAGGKGGGGLAVPKPAVSVGFGLAAALCYGAGGFLLGSYSRQLGWLVPVVIARAGSMVVLLGLLATPLRRSRGGRLATGLAWAAVAGVTDAIALVSFTRGDQVGLVAITAAVSSVYPVIPLLGGMLLLRERLAAWQVGGAVLTIAGIALLAVGS